MVALRKLDAKAKQPASIFTYTLGVLSALVFGLGMCLTMGQIGSGTAASFVVGIFIGILGIFGMSVNYPRLPETAGQKGRKSTPLKFWNWLKRSAGSKKKGDGVPWTRPRVNIPTPPGGWTGPSWTCWTGRILLTSPSKNFARQRVSTGPRSTCITRPWGPAFGKRGGHYVGIPGLYAAGHRGIHPETRDCPREELYLITPEYLTPYLSFIREHQRLMQTALAHAATLGLENSYAGLLRHVIGPILDRYGVRRRTGGI